MTQRGICRIVGAGEGFADFAPVSARAPGDVLIAADGGLAALERLGLVPDVTLGDFDSLGHVPTQGEVLRWPSQKDDTDMLLAVKLGLSRGYRRFYLYGGAGGRLDHTLANLQTLAFAAAQGAQAYLFADGQTLTVLRGPATAHFAAVPAPLAPAQALVSVFAMGGEAAGVTLRGLHYPLREAVLTPCMPLGVSNRRTAAGASISLHAGMLLLAWGAPSLPTVRRLPAHSPCAEGAGQKSDTR